MKNCLFLLIIIQNKIQNRKIEFKTVFFAFLVKILFIEFFKFQNASNVWKWCTFQWLILLIRSNWYDAVDPCCYWSASEVSHRRSHLEWTEITTKNPLTNEKFYKNFRSIFSYLFFRDDFQPHNFGICIHHACCGRFHNMCSGIDHTCKTSCPKNLTCVASAQPAVHVFWLRLVPFSSLNKFRTNQIFY